MRYSWLGGLGGELTLFIWSTLIIYVWHAAQPASTHHHLQFHTGTSMTMVVPKHSGTTYTNSLTQLFMDKTTYVCCLLLLKYALPIQPCFVTLIGFTWAVVHLCRKTKCCGICKLTTDVQYSSQQHAIKHWHFHPLTGKNIIGSCPQVNNKLPPLEYCCLAAQCAFSVQLQPTILIIIPQLFLWFVKKRDGMDSPRAMALPARCQYWCGCPSLTSLLDLLWHT